MWTGNRDIGYEYSQYYIGEGESIIRLNDQWFLKLTGIRYHSPAIIEIDPPLSEEHMKGQ